MAQPIVRDAIYRRFRFAPEIIETVVRWYISYRLRLFSQGAGTELPKWPTKITLEGHMPSHSGLRLLRIEDPKWKYVLVRTNRYPNNIVEQDNRAIKRRCQSMLGFKSFRTAAVTLSGIELAHRIRKRQFRFGPGNWPSWSLKQQWDRALAC